MSFKSIVLGTQHKSYTHDMSFDNNTTMEFGVLQPLLSQYMLPQSSIKVNTKQLVRLAPMPTPSFARMYLANFASYVKMTDVVPYHECLLSKIPFSVGGKSYTPTMLPYTTNKSLMYAILYNSFVDVYKESVNGGTFDVVKDKAELASVKSLFVKTVLGSVPAASSPLLPKFSFVYDDFTSHDSITPLSADFTLTIGDLGEYLMCFKFSASSCRLRKVLLGLGYSLSFVDTTRLSIAPLLAFYKAYYDRFGLVRDLPFESTLCFQLIKAIENYDIGYTLSSTSDPLFLNFLLSEVSNCWYTSSNSYIAAHRSSITNSLVSRKLDVSKGQIGSNTRILNTNNESIDYPYMLVAPSGGTAFTSLSLDLLKRLTTFVNKDSAIGKRISDWVRVHYGAEVSNSLFEQSNRINEWRTNIDIDDIFSTSDTADIGTENKGDFLGSYAGKGSGFSSNGFTFKAPYHGFVFVLSCIVPITNTFQGNDPTLLAVDLDTIPQPEFDALGFEATPRSVFVGDNGYASTTLSSKFGNTFGFVPRYTGFKVKKNIVNGDMCKGFFQTDLLPYFNDRILYNNVMSVGTVVSDASQHVSSFSFKKELDKVPNASTEFQKVCRYAFMGDYNRLFYKHDSVHPFVLQDLNDYSSDDNFIVQSVFDVRVSNWLKPVQNSYDTIDEQTDNNTTSVDSI